MSERSTHRFPPMDHRARRLQSERDPTLQWDPWR